MEYNGVSTIPAYASYDSNTYTITLNPALATQGDIFVVRNIQIFDDYLDFQYSGRQAFLFGIDYPKLPTAPEAEYSYIEYHPFEIKLPPATDADGDEITYELFTNESPIPNWLVAEFPPSSSEIIFSGIPEGKGSTYLIHFKVIDASTASFSNAYKFSISVTQNPFPSIDKTP